MKIRLNDVVGREGTISKSNGSCNRIRVASSSLKRRKIIPKMVMERCIASIGDFI